MRSDLDNFWQLSERELFSQLETSPEGLTQYEAKARLLKYGLNHLRPKRKNDWLTLLLRQFTSPITLILIFAALISFYFHDTTNTVIILLIIALSGILSFFQEYSANQAVNSLLTLVQVKAVVIRHGQPTEIPSHDVVPGDIVVLSAGENVPADCRIIEAKDFFVDEATLTGESFPVEKEPLILKAKTTLAERKNTGFMGTHIVSGSATAVVVATGQTTEFGRIADQLKVHPTETDFEKGVRRFGYLLLEVTLLLVFAIFVVNVFLNRPVLESLLFSLALAVGLTPQLLPAIISINLAHGAKKMAQKKVIVKRLASIENFGSMNVLCSDKTGTLTEGSVKLHSALDATGKKHPNIMKYAYLAAFYDSGFTNPINEAIRSHHAHDAGPHPKIDEVPYDSHRKHLSILVKDGRQNLMIMKGTVDSVLAASTHYEGSDGKALSFKNKADLEKQIHSLSQQGLRVLGIAYKKVGDVAHITKADETEMVFLGYLAFSDQPKAGIAGTIRHLEQLGVTLKVISGDNRLVAQNVGRQVGLDADKIMTGSELRELSDEALLQKANETVIFAEIEPNQKEHIVSILKKAGNIVGYMGDGVNDTPALHTADVSISVDRAVDVAKETADIVLLRKDLAVLIEGVKEGRQTFANTLKYVFMATSANFGNMFSMAGASLFLPFLPLLPTQILMTNVLTDFPETAIATDNVDHEDILVPRRWDLHFIRNFMITFGLLSSLFDFLVFVVLLLGMQASAAQFRTAWFMESVISASLVVLVIRTHKPFFLSRPGKYLLRGTILVGILTILLPYTPILGDALGFTPLSPAYLLILGLIIFAYILMAELAKKLFYDRFKR